MGHLIACEQDNTPPNNNILMAYGSHTSHYRRLLAA